MLANDHEGTVGARYEALYGATFPDNYEDHVWFECAVFGIAYGGLEGFAAYAYASEDDDYPRWYQDWGVETLEEALCTAETVAATASSEQAQWQADAGES